MTKQVEKPIFHVSLVDHDDWVVEAEWSDGTLERLITFKNYSAATDWIGTVSKAWLHERL
jgi:pterin-4a-carbinolamine dehydratase